MAFIIDWAGILSVKLRQLQRGECKVFLNYLIEITGKYSALLLCWRQKLPLGWSVRPGLQLLKNTGVSLQQNRCSSCFSIGCLMRNLLLFCWAGAPLLRSLLGSPGAGGEPGKPRFDETHEKSLGFEGASNNAPARLFGSGDWLLWFDLLINTLEFGVWEAELIFNCCEHLCLVEN